MKGIITKGIAGFYYVKCDGQVYRCRARGIFKKKGIVPLVGDIVEISPDENSDGTVEKIFPRDNWFVRPPIANIEILAVTVSAAEPPPSTFILDRFLVMAEKHNVKSIICINKKDLAKGNEIEELRSVYKEIYPVICLCGLTGEGTDLLKDHFRGKRVAFAGPSGVGKSTILNRLLKEERAEIGEISPKTGRGKQTTRHVEIFDINGCMVYDTPGFTSFNILDADEDELSHFYPEMKEYLNKCRYDNCRHVMEPDCSVREAVELGIIKRSRYDSYVEQIKEIRKKKKY
jgi:ribosome biogenesis GTPase